MTERHKFIGGGNVAGILGKSKWSSPYAQWAFYVGLMPDTESNLRMRIGTNLQAGIARTFEEETGLYVAGEEMELSRPDAPWAIGHTDGLVFDGAVEEPSIDLALGGLEVKSAGGAPWDEVPDYYLCQIDHYLWLSGLDRWWVAVLFGGFGITFRSYVVERDQARIDAQVAVLDEFWHRYVVTGVAPTVDGSDATHDALAFLFPDHQPGTRTEIDGDLFANWEAARIARLDAEEEAKAAGAEEALYRNQILADIEDAELVCVDGVPVLSCRTTTRKGIDREALERDLPDVAAKYRTETSFRSLRLASKADKGKVA